MDAIERDLTDLGLSPILSFEELESLRESARIRRERPGADVPSGPPALPRQRSEAMRLVSEALGWNTESRSKRLATRCVRCGAPSLRWCRSRGREVSGRLCEERSAAG